MGACECGGGRMSDIAMRRFDDWCEGKRNPLLDVPIDVVAEFRLHTARCKKDSTFSRNLVTVLSAIRLRFRETGETFDVRFSRHDSMRAALNARYYHDFVTMKLPVAKMSVLESLGFFVWVGGSGRSSALRGRIDNKGFVPTRISWVGRLAIRNAATVE